MSAEIWDWLMAGESGSALICNFGLGIAEFITPASRWLVGAVKADAAGVSAAFLVSLDCWPEVPSTETILNIIGMLIAALIAAGAAMYSARSAASSTMENARKLQDRERHLDEKSIAALLSADLHRKLIWLVQLFPERKLPRMKQLATMETNTKVFEAALPKLGALDHQGVANLLAAFDGIAQLARDAHSDDEDRNHLTERMRSVALHIGGVLIKLWELYELDRPEPLEKVGVNLEALGLGELKKLGL